MTGPVTSVLQGEYRISRRPDEILTTVLGSCIAVCLCDRTMGIGGMNHFLLAQNTTGGNDTVRYGTYAMELLINDLLKHGAARHRLEAKVFGGARMLSVQNDIGARNAEFARTFLRDEGIPCLSESTGGTSARRIRFWPVTGRAQQLLVQETVPPAQTAPPPQPASGGITLF